MEQDKATSSQVVFSKAHMKAIAGVVAANMNRHSRMRRRTTAAKTQAPTRHLEAKEVALKVCVGEGVMSS